jgi:hypothetical protein
MKQTVDAWVGRLGVLDWRRRGDLLAEASLPFGQDLPPDKAKIAARGFVTAVLERLPTAKSHEIDDPYQALLYLASLDPGHRTQAEAYLDAHPEVRGEGEEDAGDN